MNLVTVGIESANLRVQHVERQISAPDARIAELARRQHGVVARRQLLRMGVSRESIAVKLRNGRLHRLHAGVYAVGHTVLVAEGRWMAGILAGGEGAVLSHRSAAALWCLLDDRDDLIDVTTPRSARSRGIVRGHRAEMAADEVTQRSILPVTTVSRTVFDLAAVVPDSVLERAMREAEVLRLPFRPSLDELISRYPQRSGLRSLRICMQRLGMTHGISRSQLEDRFLRLVERAALPPPKTNVRMSLGQGAGIEVECLWREEGVIVELDGHSAHGTRSAFELDRERDRQLQASGWRVVRITWRQLDEPTAIVADLRRMLSGDQSAVVRPMDA